MMLIIISIAITAYEIVAKFVSLYDILIVNEMFLLLLLLRLLFQLHLLLLLLLAYVDIEL